MTDTRPDGPFAGTSWRFRAYYALVVGLGAWLAALFFPTARIDSWGPLLWWIAFAIIADMSPILLPGSRAYITVSSALDYAAIVVFGPVVAAMISTISTVVTTLTTSRKSLHKLLFNACLFIVTIMVAGRVFVWLGGHATRSPAELVLPMAGCGITYFLIDTFGVSLVVALSQRGSVWRIWQRTYLWTTITHLVGFVPLGAIIVVIFMHIGIPGVALFLVPLLLARYSFKLYTDMREVHIETVRALTSAIDASDPYTKGHSERVTLYATALAREMRLSERRVQAIEYAGLLHDMGKIGLQHTILLKPGSLTDSEWEEMKRHPETGAKIVKELHFLTGARDVVLYHHERFDGTGYPRGLVGEQIPLEARIVKVADAFDAMLSDRPYRKALSLDGALGQLQDGSGREFDPRAVEAFVALVKRGEIRVPAPNGQQVP